MKGLCVLVLHTPFICLCFPREEIPQACAAGPWGFQDPEGLQVPSGSVISEITLFKTLCVCVLQCAVLKSPPFKKEKCRKKQWSGLKWWAEAPGVFRSDPAVLCCAAAGAAEGAQANTSFLYQELYCHHWWHFARWMKIKNEKQPQPSEFAIGYEDNVPYIKCGGIENGNISYYSFCFRFYALCEAPGCMMSVLFHARLQPREDWCCVVLEGCGSILLDLKQQINNSRYWKGKGWWQTTGWVFFGVEIRAMSWSGSFSTLKPGLASRQDLKQSSVFVEFTVMH